MNLPLPELIKFVISTAIPNHDNIEKNDELVEINK